MMTEIVMIGFGTALTIGLPVVLCGIVWKLVHLWI